jgi:hypothetical protein
VVEVRLHVSRAPVAVLEAGQRCGRRTGSHHQYLSSNPIDINIQITKLALPRSLQRDLPTAQPRSLSRDVFDW